MAETISGFVMIATLRPLLDNGGVSYELTLVANWGPEGAMGGRQGAMGSRG